jgi:hypothetical protein
MLSGGRGRNHQGPSFRVLQVIDHVGRFAFSIVRLSKFRALRASGSRETDFAMRSGIGAKMPVEETAACIKTISIFR